MNRKIDKTRKSLRTTKKDKKIKVFDVVKYFIIAVSIIVLLIMLPLTLVWKQVYINSSSISFESLRDSIEVLHKKHARLNIRAEQLSQTARIEKIAREQLDLDYPASKEIVVIRFLPKKGKKFVLDTPFWAVLKRSLTLKKG